MLRATFALVALCVGLSFVAAQQPKPAVTMDDIKKAWQDRQDKVKTLKVSWKQELSYPRGSLTLFLKGAGFNASGPQPPKDLFINGDSSLAIVGDTYRWDVDRKSWNGEKTRLDPFAYTIIFDGKQHMQHFREINGKSYQTLAVSKASHLGPATKSVELFPVLWFARGCDKQFGGGILDDFEVTGRTVAINGSSCAELRSDVRKSRKTTLLYVDVRKCFNPVRYIVLSNVGDTPSLQLEIDYQSDKILAWRPARWRQVVNSPASKESIMNSVDKFLINGVLSTSDLKPLVTPGTLVIDETKSDITRTIIQEDGKSGRPVTGTMDYSKIQVLAKHERFPKRLLRYIGVATCGMTVVAILVIRWRRRRK